MSKVYCVSLNKTGIFMIGDRRATYLNDDGSVSERQDNFQKVFKVGPNLLVGIAGNADYSAKAVKFVKSVVNDDKDYNYPEGLAQFIGEQFRSSFKNLPQKLQPSILIAGYSLTGNSHLFKIAPGNGYLTTNSHYNMFGEYSDNALEQIGMWDVSYDAALKSELNAYFTKRWMPCRWRHIISKLRKAMSYYANTYDSISSETDEASILYLPKGVAFNRS